jgi:hypothetical protein
METEQLDQILQLQLAVAWAGEAKTEPPKLGWWRTGMCDEFGGEDLLKRLAPKTWEWAVLEACRAAAKKVDDAARSNSEDADHLISLYRFGFEVDEHLDDRLRELKLSERPPSQVFPDLADLMKQWSRDSFQSWVANHGETHFTATATGRRLRGEIPSDTSDAAKQLVAGLAPLKDKYPLPHFRVAR